MVTPPLHGIDGRLRQDWRAPDQFHIAHRSIRLHHRAQNHRTLNMLCARRRRINWRRPVLDFTTRNALRYRRSNVGLNRSAAFGIFAGSDRRPGKRKVGCVLDYCRRVCRVRVGIRLFIGNVWLARIDVHKSLRTTRATRNAHILSHIAQQRLSASANRAGMSLSAAATNRSHVPTDQ